MIALLTLTTLAAQPAKRSWIASASSLLLSLVVLALVVWLVYRVWKHVSRRTGAERTGLAGHSMEREKVKDITYTCPCNGDDVWVCTRVFVDKGYFSLVISEEHNGDIEVCMDRQSAQKLIDLVQWAINNTSS